MWLSAWHIPRTSWHRSAQSARHCYRRLENQCGYTCPGPNPHSLALLESEGMNRLASTADITTGLQLCKTKALRRLKNCLISDSLFVGCLTSQQQASVSQGRICSDNFTCCHTEIEVADQTFYLTQSQYTDTGPTSPSADPIMPGAWQGSHWSANFEVTGMTRPRKNPGASGIRTRDLPLSRRTPYH